jgi:hypothetical protein
VRAIIFPRKGGAADPMILDGLSLTLHNAVSEFATEASANVLASVPCTNAITQQRVGYSPMISEGGTPNHLVGEACSNVNVQNLKPGLNPSVPLSFN